MEDLIYKQKARNYPLLLGISSIVFGIIFSTLEINEKDDIVGYCLFSVGAILLLTGIFYKPKNILFYSNHLTIGSQTINYSNVAKVDLTDQEIDTGLGKAVDLYFSITLEDSKLIKFKLGSLGADKKYLTNILSKLPESTEVNTKELKFIVI